MEQSGIINVEANVRPEIGELVRGTELRDSSHGCGFVRTDREVIVMARHVVETNKVPNGFYVIGIFQRRS